MTPKSEAIVCGPEGLKQCRKKGREVMPARMAPRTTASDKKRGMNVRAWMAVALVLVVAPLARAQTDGGPPTNFDEYEDAYRFKCNAPLVTFEPPDVRELGGFRYEHTGSTVKIRRTSPRHGPLRIGVLSAVKDVDPETLSVVQGFLDRFEKDDAELIVVGGDTAEEPAALEKFYVWIAGQTKRPVLTVPGNSERPAAHNYAVIKARRAGALNLITVNLVRHVDADGIDVVGLGGYYNKAFLHMGGACVYSPGDVEAVVAAAKTADDPVLLLMHGPPQQKGKAAIDYVPGDGNVGDPQITRAIQEAKIPFGIHGHILEAGGTATDLTGHPVKPGKLVPALYLNPGSANPLPWKLNAGGTSYGMAAVLTIQGKKAKYEVLRAPKPVAKDDVR